MNAKPVVLCQGENGNKPKAKPHINTFQLTNCKQSKCIYNPLVIFKRFTNQLQNIHTFSR